MTSKPRVVQAAWSLLRDGRGQEITQRAILGDHLQALEYLKGFQPEALAPLEALAQAHVEAERAQQALQGKV